MCTSFQFGPCPIGYHWGGGVYELQCSQPPTRQLWYFGFTFRKLLNHLHIQSMLWSLFKFYISSLWYMGECYSKKLINQFSIWGKSKHHWWHDEQCCAGIHSGLVKCFIGQSVSQGLFLYFFYAAQWKQCKRNIWSRTKKCFSHGFTFYCSSFNGKFHAVSFYFQYILHRLVK